MRAIKYYTAAAIGTLLVGVAGTHAQTVNQAADFAFRGDGVLVSSKYVQVSPLEIAVEMDISATDADLCASAFSAPVSSLQEGWDAICENVIKLGEGRFSGRLTRNNIPGATPPVTYRGPIEREGDTRQFEMAVTVGPDACPTQIGANTDANIFKFVDVTACTASIPQGDGETAEVNPPSPPDPTPKPGGDLRIELTRNQTQLSGFAERLSPSLVSVDFKFETTDENACREGLVGSGIDGVSWARLCAAAFRTGGLRMAGDLSASRRSRSDAFFEGFVEDPQFDYDGMFEVRITGDCVSAIGPQATTGGYALRATECGRALGIDPNSLELPPDPNQGGGGSDDSSSNQSGLIPGGNTDQRNNNPVPGTADDLWPEADRNIFAKYCHNGDSRADCSETEEWIGDVRLIRNAPGSEQITLSNVKGCPNFSTNAFCALAIGLNGQSIAIEDYGFDGEKGVGHFTHDGTVWFVTLNGDGGNVGASLRADFTPTLLAIDTLLGANPNAADRAALDTGIAYEDFFPVAGKGHMQVFLDERMAVPGRPNLSVPSGDVLLSEGMPDQPAPAGRGRTSGGERLYALDFGQCPDGVSAQFCRSVESNINGSFPLEDYRYNGNMATAQVTFGSRHYWMTLQPNEDETAIRLQMHLIENPDQDEFSSFVVGIEKEDEEDESKNSNNLAFEDACTARMDVSNMVRIIQPVSQHNQRLAFCTVQGQCADDAEGDMTTSLCEIARWKNVRDRKTSFTDYDLWNRGCAVRGSQGASTQLDVPWQPRLRATDGLGVYYQLHARMYQNPAMIPTEAGYHRDCSNCDMVETLYCAPDNPAVFGE
ncbi:MAG: hypothetical protein AAGG69_00930 [Pseudomonadota bacterium]